MGMQTVTSTACISEVKFSPFEFVISSFRAGVLTPWQKGMILEASEC